MCGANQFPGCSTTSEVVSNDSSPENTFSLVALESLGFSSANSPYDPLLARVTLVLAIQAHQGLVRQILMCQTVASLFLTRQP